MRFKALKCSPACSRNPAPSVLHPRHDDPFHQVLLAEDVDDDAGYDRQDGRDHGQVPDSAVGAAEHAEPQGHGGHVAVQEIDGLLQYVVPHGQEDEYGDDHDGGLDVRHDDLQQYADAARAVDHRGLVKLARDGHDELAHEEDIERAAPAQPGEYQGPVRVDQPEDLGPDDVERDKGDHGRKQHGGDAQPEDEFLAAEPEPREGIPAHDGGRGPEDHRGPRDDQGILEIEKEVEVLECLRVVRKQPAAGQ